MFRWILSITLLLFVSSFASAQSDEETKFNEKQAKALNDYAETAMDEGFPKVAKRIWLMILAEYDTDCEGAREGLGYENIDGAWGMKPDFVYPKDDNPDSKAASKVKKKWEGVAKNVAKAHKSMAEKYENAGRTDLSVRHYKKVIYYAPDDEDAQAALNHKTVGGTTGTGLEQILYDRSKKIEDIVAVEARKDYPVERLPDTDRHPFLDAAKVDYISVKSENFIVRGDFDEKLLMTAAQYAERSAKVMAVVCEGFAGFATEPRFWTTDNAFFKSNATYRQVISANPEGRSPAQLKFVLENTAGTNIFKNGRVLGIQAPANEQGVYDGMVRSVAQEFSGLRSAGLREGIGHAITGMMFNNNRQFIVDREEQQRSSAGEEDVDAFSPNMDTWGDLALEAAWKLAEGTPAAKLPLISAAEFPDDARIKAWSFCDYVVRRDPTLLSDLDKLGGLKHPIEVEKKFTADHNGLSIAELEKEWKDFWTEATPVLKDIRNNTPPLETISKDAKKWLEEFNKARKDIAVTSVTFSADYSGRCKDHAQYLVLHEELRGPVAEQMENPEIEGGTHLGDLFANMACVDTEAKKPRDVFKRWMDLPGYRDAVLNNGLRAVGIYVEDEILVMDVIRGVDKGGQESRKAYPAINTPSVPTKVSVADLGPEVQALLEKHGEGSRTELGYPVSLHNFGLNGLIGERDSYHCKLTYQDIEIEGILHLADGGTNRRSSAPGMVVFYPLEPLPKGRQFKAVWTYDLRGSTARLESKFNT
tara:strand:- start:9626 stop:11902 length:2277 start_codon:yes stop_codon:yes gene_type:complete